MVSGPSCDPPLVSIVVPVFNGERHLRTCLDSIVGQTYPPCEILVMDDASSDATPQIIAEYGARLRHVRQPRNRGQFDNVNDGLALAAGTYIAVYHADDVYTPDIVAREVAFLESHPAAGAVFCYDIFINAEGREYGRLTVPPEIRARTSLDYATVLNGILTHKNRFLPTPGAMVRSAVYREVGPYRGDQYRIAADMEMWLRIARRHDLGLLHEYLFSYRHGHENASQTYYRLRTEPERHFVILDEHLAAGGRALAAAPALRAHEAHRAEDGLMVAINHYIRGDRGAALEVLRTVRLTALMGSSQIQRARLVVLLVALHVLLRIRVLPLVADAFYRRWHVKTYQP